MTIKISLFVLFILLSGFFSSAETALTAINKLKLRNIVDKKKKGYKLLAKLLDNPRQLLTGILIGNNFANVSATVVFTSIVMQVLEANQVPSSATIMGLITGTLTLLLLIFGEITPKTIAFKNPESLSLSYSRILYSALFVLKPIIKVIDIFSRLLQRILKIDPDSFQTLLTEDELKSIITIGEEEGLLEKEERKMIHSIVDFSETIVREIMTPRTDVYFINTKKSVRDAIELIIDKGHSRIPIYEEKIDNTVGIIYAKDLLKVTQDKKDETLHNYFRQANYTPETTNVESLLHQMKKDKFHMAIVVDEHGGVSGIVTLEDILEEIVGEIQDEYDKDEQPPIVELKPDHFLVDAKINIQELATALSTEFPDDEDFDTLGGFILSVLGRLPSKGERIEHLNLDLIIKEFSKRRIKTIEIIRRPLDDTNDENSVEQ